MSKRLSYERYVWFHQRLKQKKYPTLRDMMEEFEISKRQAAREIESMRLFFKAPVEYSAAHRGYYYEDDHFELPGPMVSQEELISLVIARRLSVTIPDQERKHQLDMFFQHLSPYLNLDITQIERKISLKNVRYFRVQPQVFDRVLKGLIEGKKLDIAYRSVHTGEFSRRVIQPLHLVLYMGNWHIIAFCEKRQGLRDFALSRISEIRLLDEPIDLAHQSLDIKKNMDEAHGIFFDGARREKVVLKFSERIAEYVKEQVWFPGQTVTESQGRLILTFYVTDYREVMREILSFGADVEVLEPGALRETVTAESKKLSTLYGIE